MCPSSVVTRPKICPSMALILDGISEIGANVGRNLSYLICLRHLIRSRAITNWIFSPNMHIFLHACAICSELPSYIGTMCPRKLYRGNSCYFFNDNPRLKIPPNLTRKKTRQKDLILPSNWSDRLMRYFL